MPQEVEKALFSFFRRRDHLREEVLSRARQLDAAAALDLLATRRCPACAFVEEREKKFFLWFALEHYVDFGTIERLDAALGFCPRHCRTLLRLHVYTGTLTHVYEHVAVAALERVEGKGAEGECIGCEHERWASGHAVGLVVESLSDPAAERAFRSSRGFCILHLLEALHRDGRGTALRLLSAFEAAHAGEVPERTLIETFCGTDADAPVRANYLERLPEDPIDSSNHRTTTLERLRAMLEIDSCPCCLSAGQARRRYLVWIGAERHRSRDFARELIELCPAHLADRSVRDPESAAWLASQKSVAWRGALARFAFQKLESSEGMAPTPGRRRWARWESLREDLRRALGPKRQWLREVQALREQLPPCGACRAERTAADRTAALLGAISEDVPLATRYEASHGLCVHHVLTFPPEGNAFPRRVCRARLKLLAWELAEAGRKLDWFVRYESRGDESTA
jgi:hypothetical protein